MEKRRSHEADVQLFLALTPNTLVSAVVKFLVLLSLVLLLGEDGERDIKLRVDLFDIKRVKVVGSTVV
jgi:hypothetical protein